MKQRRTEGSIKEGGSERKIKTHQRLVRDGFLNRQMKVTCYFCQNQKKKIAK